jgi:hypothetical protein
MSNQSDEQSNPSQGRQPGGGRRSGGGQNRNRSGNREGGNRDGNREGGNRDGNREGGNNRNRNRNRNRGGQGQGQDQTRNPQRRTEKPATLTLWQKILKAVGLSKPRKHTSPSRVPKPATPPARGGGNRGERRDGGNRGERRDGGNRGERRDGGNRGERRDGGNRGERRDGGERRERGPRKERNSGEEPRKRAPQSDAPVNSGRLYLGNLSYEATEYELEDLFKGIGAIKSIEVVYNRNTHRSKGYGFVVMRSIEDAKRAVEVLHDQPFMGRQLIVSGAKSDGPAEGDSRAQEQETNDVPTPPKSVAPTPAPPVEPTPEAASEPTSEADDNTGGDDEEAAA